MATAGRFKALLAATAAVFLLSITAVFAQDSKVTRIQRGLLRLQSQRLGSLQK